MWFPIPELPKRTRDIIERPEPTWPTLVDREIRLQELDLKRRELEVRRLEALAKLEEARSRKDTDND